MANETITDQSATTSVAATDVLELEQTGPVTRKITAPNLAIGLRTLAFSGALVKKLANQTTANYAGFPVVTWDGEEYDTDAYHSTVTNTSRLTVPAAGYYVVGGLISVASGTLTASDFIRFSIGRFNSGGVGQSAIGLPSPMAEISSTGPAVAVTGVSMPVSCASGDYFELYFDTESDTSITVEASSWFGIWRVA
jgi:hypothetical protein